MQTHNNESCVNNENSTMTVTRIQLVRAIRSQAITRKAVSSTCHTDTRCVSTASVNKSRLPGMPRAHALSHHRDLSARARQQQSALRNSSRGHASLLPRQRHARHQTDGKDMSRLHRPRFNISSWQFYCPHILSKIMFQFRLTTGVKYFKYFTPVKYLY